MRMIGIVARTSRDMAMPSCRTVGDACRQPVVEKMKIWPNVLTHLWNGVTLRADCARDIAAAAECVCQHVLSEARSRTVVTGREVHGGINPVATQSHLNDSVEIDCWPTYVRWNRRGLPRRWPDVRSLDSREGGRSRRRCAPCGDPGPAGRTH